MRLVCLLRRVPSASKEIPNTQRDTDVGSGAVAASNGATRLPAASVRTYEKSTVNVSEKRYCSPRVKGKVKLASPGRAPKSSTQPLAEQEAE